MVIGGTPGMRIEIGTQKQNERIPVREDKVNEAVEDCIKDVAAKEMKLFANLVKESIITQLELMPTHRAKEGKGKDRSLREEIIKSIHLGQRGTNWVITIDHELARALNDGTGEFGPYHTPIIPTNREYLFIPGEMYQKLYGVRKERFMKNILAREAKWKSTGIKRTYGRTRPSEDVIGSGAKRREAISKQREKIVNLTKKG